MPHSITRQIARAGRAALVPVALCLAAAGAQAQVTSSALTAVLTDLLTISAPASYANRRDANVVAAKSMSCRIQARHRGLQRKSYGSASPRNRQQLNDCSPMGAPT